MHNGFGCAVHRASTHQIQCGEELPQGMRADACQRLQSRGLPSSVRGGRRFHAACGNYTFGSSIQKVAPELVDGYARYYLRSAGRSATGDVRAALAAEFPLPETIMGAINRQVDIVLGGI